MRKFDIGVCLLALLLTAGCVNRPVGESGERQVSDALPSYATIVPLVDGSRIFSQTVNLLQAAHSTIFYEMYEIGYQPAVDQLLKAQRRGVEVYVITDPTVPLSLTVGRQLAGEGIHVRYLPIPHGIDHTKLIVADSQAAIIGGMNHGVKSYRNHDADVLLRGEEISDLGEFFVRDWYRANEDTVSLAKGGADDRPHFPESPRHVSSAVTALEDEQIGRQLLPALRQAKSAVEVEMYTLTDLSVLRALVERHQAGVSVRVILDPAQPYNEAGIQILRSAGVPVRFYPASGYLLHMKLGIIDHQAVFIGSANWTHAGLGGGNHEMDVEIQDPSVAAFFSKLFRDNFQISKTR